jgi:hypothetical protein
MFHSKASSKAHKLSRTLAFQPADLFPVPPTKQANDTLFLNDYALGECHCHPSKSRGLEGDAPDNRQAFQKDIVDTLIKTGKKSLSLLGIGTGFLLPTASLIAHLVREGSKKIDIHVVDPLYTDKDPNWLKTKIDFKRLMTDCGFICFINNDLSGAPSNLFTPTICLHTYQNIKDIKAEQIATFDCAYCYDMFPEKPAELADILDFKQKLGSTPIHISFDVIPSKAQLLDFIKEKTALTPPNAALESNWSKLIDTLFDDKSYASFGALEKAFQSCLQKESPSFARFANLVFYEGLHQMMLSLLAKEALAPPASCP